MDGLKKRLKAVEEHGKSGRGKSEYIKFLSGQRVSAGQAIKAKCYDCTGFYADGVEDCGSLACALYPFHPYNKNKQKSRVMSDEQRKASGDRLRKMRGGKGE